MRITNHARDRMFERNISPDSIIDTVRNGSKIAISGDKIFFRRKAQNGTCIAVSGSDGTLVTAYIKTRKRKKAIAKGIERRRKNVVKLTRLKQKLEEIKQEINEGV